MEWTAPEVAKLRELKAEGKTVKQIAETINRSANSVEKKWKSLQKNGSFEAEQTPITPCNQYPHMTMRGAVIDIETTSFKAGGVQDHLVCICVFPLDNENIITLRMRFDDSRDDRRLLGEAKALLESVDLWIGHSITHFDIPWINSRLVYHGIQPITNKFLTYDTYEAARRCCIKAERKSLAFLIDFFRFKQQKTSVYPVSWSQVDSPNRDEFAIAMEDIVSHCEADVRMNRELFWALWRVDRSMTNLPIYRK